MSATSPLYGKTHDGLFAALVGDQAFAMIPFDNHLAEA